MLDLANVQPLAAVPEAPQKYHRMFEQASASFEIGPMPMLAEKNMTRRPVIRAMLAA